MRPYQHGEVFVTDDGAETDLDLGHYERFTTARMTRAEQLHHRPHLRGGHLEGAPRRVPRRDGAGHPAHHRRDQGARPRRAPRAPTSPSSRSAAPSATSSRCRSSRRSASSRSRPAPQNALSVHVTLVPYIATAGELKTKPTQHSVKEMREIGIQPDILLCRCDRPLSRAIEGEDRALLQRRRRRASSPRIDVACIYELPLALHAEGLDEQRHRAAQHLGAPAATSRRGTRIVERFKKPVARRGEDRRRRQVRPPPRLVQVAARGARPRRPRTTTCSVDLEYIDSEQIEQRRRRGAARRARRHPRPGRLRRSRHRGEDRRRSATRARTRCRSSASASACSSRSSSSRATSAGMAGANSTEFDRDAPHPVIDLMPDQRGVRDKGGTMRLGAYPCVLDDGLARRRGLRRDARSASATATATRSTTSTASSWRRRASCSRGTSPDKRLVEMVELRDHPYFVGCQFHPEFKSRPHAPHPLFARFVRAALERQRERTKATASVPKSATRPRRAPASTDAAPRKPSSAGPLGQVTRM